MADGLWESYFWPDDSPGGHRALRNKLDIRDPDRLRGVEYEASSRRAREIVRDQVAIPRTFDLDHLKTIHGYLFQDVYDWAGQLRTVDMAKGEAAFAPINGGIERTMAAVSKGVNQTDWQSMDQPTVARHTAMVFNAVNYAHPFREGNGRTSRIYIEHLAEKAGLVFDQSHIIPDLWNQASHDARVNGDLTGLTATFRETLRPPTGTDQRMDGLGQIIRAAQTAYPKPPGRAAIQGDTAQPRPGRRGWIGRHLRRNHGHGK